MITIGVSGDFICRDGKRLCLVVSTDEQFARFCSAVLHRPELAEDPRFALTANRAYNTETLSAVIQEELLKYEMPELCRILDENGIVYGRINRMDDLMNHPQLAARNMIAKVVYDNGMTIITPGSPIKMSSYETPDTFHAAELGQDTVAVLSEIEDEAKLHEMFDGPVADSRKKLKDMLLRQS